MDLTVQGKRVHAATGGREFDATLPAVIFIHGGGLDHTVWALQTRYFAHRGRAVLAPDLPGHGRSDGPALTSIEALADWVVELMDAAGLEQAALVGHSMGGLIVLDCAGRHGARIRALAILGAAAAIPLHPELMAAAEANDHAAFDSIVIWGHGPAARLGHGQVPGMWMTGSGVRLLERSAPGVLYSDFVACDNYAGGMAAAAKVGCPVRLVLAGLDRLTPLTNGKALADEFHAADVIVLNGCGHMVMAEEPDAVLDALIDFV